MLKDESNLIHAELSRKIIGVLMNVHNTLGYGHPEKTYQRAVAIGLKDSGLSFEEQVYAPLLFNGKIVGRNYFDFKVENIIVLELKKGDYFAKAHIDQVYQYLVSSNLQLGLLVYFAPRKVHWKRIVNLHPYIRKISNP